nr:hypothetical protein [Candidatus Sigynarchaeota archaeon]
MEIVDSDVRRTDTDSWDLMSELPASGTTIGAETTCNANTAAETGDYSTHLDGVSTVTSSFTLKKPTTTPVDIVTVSLVSASGTTTAKAMRAYHEDIGSDGDLDEGYCHTNVSFYKLFDPVIVRNTTKVEYPLSQLYENEILFEGLQFNDTTAENSIRFGAFTDEDENLQFGIYAKPRTLPDSTIDPARLSFSGIYIPYKAHLEGFVAVPYDPADELPTGASVLFTVELVDVLDETNSYTTTYSIGSSSTSQYLAINLDIGTAAPSLHGKYVQVNFKTSCYGISTEHAHGYWVNMTLAGSTQIVPLSTGMPADLRERFYSNTFIWLYTNDPIKNLNMERTAGTNNDLKVEISGGIGEILNTPSTALSTIPNWQDTRVCFHETDSNGNTWGSKTTGNVLSYHELISDEAPFRLALKFEEAIYDDLQDCKVYEGYLKLYDEPYSGSPDLVADLEIIAVVQPWTWYQRNNYWELSPGASISAPGSYGTSANGQISAALEAPAGSVLNEAVVTYRKLPKDGKDIVIGGDMFPWNAIIEDPEVNMANVPRKDWVTIDDERLRMVYDYVDWNGLFGGMRQTTTVTYDAMSDTRSVYIQTDVEGLDAIMDLPFYSAQAAFSICPFFQPDTSNGESWVDYSLFGYRMITADATNIASITVSLLASDHGVIASFTDYFPPGTASILDACHPINLGVAVATVKFEFEFVDTALLPDDPVLVEFSGIYFEHNNRATTLTLELRKGDPVETVTETVKLPITPFTGASWATFNWTTAAIKGTCTDISIAASSTLGTGTTFDIMDASLRERDTTTNEVEQEYYLYEFNYQDRAMRLASSQLGYCEAPPGVWTTSGTVDKTASDQWLLVTNIDDDFDCEYDYSMAQMDIAGDGKLTDGINDLVQFDLDGSGGYEVRMFLTTATEIGYSDDGAFCSYSISDVNQTAIDEDENGVFEQITTTYRFFTSNSQNASERVAWDGTRWTYKPWTYLNCRPIVSQTIAIDDNQDSVAELETTASDLWPDPSPDGLPTLETRTITTRDWYYNYTAEEWQLDVEETKECDLIRSSMDFTLLCKDNQVFTDMTVVVIDPCPVVIDPRWFVCDGVRSDPNGACWFWDSNSDGTYETIFIFTEQTKGRHQAIGVAYDYNGNNRLDWEWWNFLPDSSADKFFPTYWTSNNYDFSYIRGIAYDDAWAAYLSQLGTAKFWVKFGIDIGVQLLMCLGATAAATAIGGPWAQLIAVALEAIFFIGYAIEEYYLQGTTALVDVICDTLDERNTDYQGGRYKGNGKDPNWTFAIPLINVGTSSQYAYYSVWTGVDFNLVDDNWGMSEYDLRVPNYPEAMPWILTGTGLANYGFREMTGQERRYQFQWYYREEWMAAKDTELRTDSGGNYTCFMPTIDSYGRVGYFAAPKDSVVAKYNGTPKPLPDGTYYAYDTHIPRTWILNIDTFQPTSGFKVDYAISLLASQYQACYSKASSGDPIQGGDWRIFLVNTAIAALQVAIVSGITYGISTRFPHRFNPMLHDLIKSKFLSLATVQKLFGQFSVTDLLRSIVGGLWDELVKEQFISSICIALGMDPNVAEQIGEFFWDIGEVMRDMSRGPEGFFLLAQSVVDSMTGIPLSEKTRNALAKIDKEEFIQISSILLTSENAKFQDAAIKLARNRLNNRQLTKADIKNVADTVAIVPLSFSKPEEVRKHVPEIRAALATLGNTNAGMKMSEAAGVKALRDACYLADGDDRFIKFDIYLGKGIKISWSVIQQLTVQEFLALAKYGGGMAVMSDPVVSGIDWSKYDKMGKYTNLKEFVDQLTGDDAQKLLKTLPEKLQDAENLKKFVCTGIGLFEMEWRKETTDENSPVSKAIWQKTADGRYENVADGVITPYLTTSEARTNDPRGDITKSMQWHVTVTQPVRIPELAMQYWIKSGLVEKGSAFANDLTELMNDADAAQLTKDLFKYGPAALAFRSGTLTEQAFSNVVGMRLSATYMRTYEKLRNYQEHMLKSDWRGWSGQRETRKVATRSIQALKDAPSAVTLSNVAEWKNLPKPLQDYLLANPGAVKRLQYSGQEYLGISPNHGYVLSDGAYIVRDAVDGVEFVSIVESKNNPIFDSTYTWKAMKSIARMFLNARVAYGAAKTVGATLSIPEGPILGKNFYSQIWSKESKKEERISANGQYWDIRVQFKKGQSGQSDKVLIQYKKPYSESNPTTLTNWHQFDALANDASGNPIAAFDINGQPLPESGFMGADCAGGSIETDLNIVRMGMSSQQMADQNARIMGAINHMYGLDGVGGVDASKFAATKEGYQAYEKQYQRQVCERAVKATRAMISEIKKALGLRWTGGGAVDNVDFEFGSAAGTEIQVIANAIHSAYHDIELLDYVPRTPGSFVKYIANGEEFFHPVENWELRPDGRSIDPDACVVLRAVASDDFGHSIVFEITIYADAEAHPNRIHVGGIGDFQDMGSAIASLMAIDSFLGHVREAEGVLSKFERSGTSIDFEVQFVPGSPAMTVAGELSLLASSAPITMGGVNYPSLEKYVAGNPALGTVSSRMLANKFKAAGLGSIRGSQVDGIGLIPAPVGSAHGANSAVRFRVPGRVSRYQEYDTLCEQSIPVQCEQDPVTNAIEVYVLDSNNLVTASCRQRIGTVASIVDAVERLKSLEEFFKLLTIEGDEISSNQLVGFLIDGWVIDAVDGILRFTIGFCVHNTFGNAFYLSGELDLAKLCTEGARSSVQFSTSKGYALSAEQVLGMRSMLYEAVHCGSHYGLGMTSGAAIQGSIFRLVIRDHRSVSKDNYRDYTLSRDLSGLPGTEGIKVSPYFYTGPRTNPEKVPAPELLYRSVAEFIQVLAARVYDPESHDWSANTIPLIEPSSLQQLGDGHFKADIWDGGSEDHVSGLEWHVDNGIVILDAVPANSPVPAGTAVGSLYVILELFKHRTSGLTPYYHMPAPWEFVRCGYEGVGEEQVWVIEIRTVRDGEIHRITMDTTTYLFGAGGSSDIFPTIYAALTYYQQHYP